MYGYGPLVGTYLRDMPREPYGTYIPVRVQQQLKDRHRDHGACRSESIGSDAQQCSASTGVSD